MLEYFDMLEDVLDSSKGRPFSTKISVEREAVFDIIGEMRLNLPNEIRQARKIIEDHDRIIDDAKNRSNVIIMEAQEKAKELTGEHAIYELAKESANEIIDEAKKNAREIRIGTMSYADEILSKSEETIRGMLESLSTNFRNTEEGFSETIDTLYKNRQEIRGTKE
jgi:vacuolar-type H+-ATPase subunit H